MSASKLPAIEIGVSQFGRLTVVGLVGTNKDRQKVWLCKCSCGNFVEVRTNSLNMGRSKSCGCLQREWAATIADKHLTTHGQTGTRTYNSYQSMLARCYYPLAISYPNYGGRGITVCDRWRESFENFYADMGDRPPRHSLDRIDSNKNYEPQNCRWATKRVQSNNCRTNHIIEIDGRKQSLMEWCMEYSIPRTGPLSYDTVKQRINKLKWEPKKALTTPVEFHRRKECHSLPANATQPA
jgi:hypothetical protein